VNERGQAQESSRGVGQAQSSVVEERQVQDQVGGEGEGELAGQVGGGGRGSVRERARPAFRYGEI
jgi:hypothetical protein